MSRLTDAERAHPIVHRAEGDKDSGRGPEDEGSDGLQVDIPSSFLHLHPQHVGAVVLLSGLRDDPAQHDQADEPTRLQC